MPFQRAFGGDGIIQTASTLMWGPWAVNQSEQWTVTMLLIDFIDVSLILNCVNVIEAVQAVINK